MNLTVPSAMLLSVHVDTLEVSHMMHKDEPLMRRFSQLHWRLSSARHRALQKFRTRTSSGNSVISNCSIRGLSDRNFFVFATPYPNSGFRADAALCCYRFGCVHMEMRSCRLIYDLVS